jgi:hypothetical protein
LNRSRVEIFSLVTQFYLGNLEILTIFVGDETRERTEIMAVSINGRTSGFRKWSETQELKRTGEARAEAGEVTVNPAPEVDRGVMPATEQLHRPWLVPGVGTL